jgi:hypothetical protein
MARLESALALSEAIHQALGKRIEVYREQGIERHRLRDGRNEVLN